MTYIGIDPGINGAIATIDNGVLSCFPFPTKKVLNRKGRKMSRLDVERLVEVLEDIDESSYPDYVMIEEPILLPNQNVASTFYNGVSHGIIHALCIAIFKIEPVLVKCRDWQDALITERTPVDSKHRRDHRKQLKLDAIAEAKKRFPGYDFTKTKKSKIDHDGFADAALIALYLSLRSNQ